MGIAGLINEDLRQAVQKFPGLGSIPVLGNLFRSQQFIKGETELVILVTPRLARPMPKDRIRLPTDDFIEPGNMEFYLLGRMEGKPPRNRDADTAAQPAAQNAGGVQSSFGQATE
jgi:pilus assembly protein CpaC